LVYQQCAWMGSRSICKVGVKDRINNFTEQTIDIIKGIPKGKIMTYGQIARLSGSPRAARQVVRILHSMSQKHSLPWHRVINSKGELSFRDDEQKLLLRIEGVEIKDGHFVSLEQFQFHPTSSDGE